MSGGYYKYRCKYWLTFNCPNWVWVNNAPCAHCLADGRDSEGALISVPFRISREVYVPQLEHGFLNYILMEIVANSEMDSGWIVKLPPTEILTVPTTASDSGFYGDMKSALRDPTGQILIKTGGD
ncbi:hypothetical protein B0O99DRAFT_681459 [Bisporella sp. PMI_857]|nr:hypothetical protein B0O99DRAFT_681459 [Bisporella sp. PMI_857]